ncbi:MAG: branched-chain amino acid aminotransferase [Pseudomonadota bacterium]
MGLGGRIATWFDGRWQEGNVPIMGAADHGLWQGTLVFDGARSWGGMAPDLDLHCARLIRSAEAMGLEPPLTAGEIEEIIREGIARFPAGQALYLRPMMWSMEGSVAIIDAEPSSTTCAICLEGLPLPQPGDYALTVSPYRRPRPEMAVTEAKAGCLYPNNARIVRDARARGFQNALSLDFEDHVAETASSNVFLVRGGEVFTPEPNGMFLAGITRARVIDLLRADGVVVRETRLTVADFHDAEEVFLTGNAAKTIPVTRFEENRLQYGPIARRARELYWDYAAGERV